jgi:hypothetical protein
MVEQRAPERRGDGERVLAAGDSQAARRCGPGEWQRRVAQACDDRC